MSETPISTSRPTLADSFSALRLPQFRRFWLAALASSSGSWLQGLATPFVMLQITDSGAWVGASVFSIMIPMALSGPIAGPTADRVSRRIILLITQTLMGVIGAAFAVCWFTGVRDPWTYIGLSTVYGLVNGFNMPAWQAYVADLVPRDELMNAITLNSAQFNAARAIGPSIGGVVLAVLGPGWSFAGNAASFFIVVFVLWTLPATHAPEGARDASPLRQFAQGFAYARVHPGMIVCFVVAFVLSVFGGTLVQVHLVLFAERVFEVGEWQFGLLVSAYGVGAISVAPWLGGFGPRHRRSALMAAGLGLFGAAELGLTATTIYPVGVAAVFLAGSAHLITASTSNTTIQLLVQDELRGRVMSLYLMVFTIGLPLGAIVQGPLAERFGTRPVVTVMGAALLGTVALLWMTGAMAAADDSTDHARKGQTWPAATGSPARADT